MKIIETNGITYLEKFDLCSEWYWGDQLYKWYESANMFRIRAILRYKL